jgi:hypothetical protein
MRRLLFVALSFATVAGVQAQALTSTQTRTFSSLNTAATDSSVTTPAATSSTSQTFSFELFSANTGVLTGVSSSLSFSGGTLALSASGTENKQSGGGKPAFSSTGSVTANSTLFTYGAINNTLANACSDSGTRCFDSKWTNLTGNAALQKSDSTWLNPAGTSVGGLNTYAGAGSVSSTLIVQNSVTLTGATLISSPQATLSTSGLTGTQNLTYSYLKHSNASFASAADSNVFSLSGITSNGSGFSIFNLGDNATTKLDYMGLQCVSGNCGAFNVTLASFQDVIAGTGRTGTAALAATSPGNYSATYTLTFSDDTAIGATATHLTNALTLNVHGTIAAPVPEPGSWALLGAGLLGLAFWRRKK